MKFPHFPLTMLAVLTLGGTGVSQIVINEIHYHPVEEPSFDINGNPAVDLTEDQHEFVELRNTGATAVDLSGWAFTSGIAFTFPASASIPAGGFRIVAKNPARLATVYGIPVAGIYGPYTGVLSNKDDTIRIKDAQGNNIDAVTYSSTFPWPATPDNLGADKDWTKIDPLSAAYNAQYKGRSLQRVSPTGLSNDPANWLASPFPGSPSPGAANAVTRPVARPVVSAFNVAQESDEASVIRPSQPARINCTFTSPIGVSDVRLEYFVDNVDSFSEARQTLVMTSAGQGEYTVLLPGLAARSVVRFRIKANRGDGLENVSPRADDVLLVPVSATVREAWHAYFVTPVRTPSTQTAPSGNGITSTSIYDVFISAGSLTQLNTNISQSPRRIDVGTAGYPREEPFDKGAHPELPDAGISPQGAWWNGAQPAIFVSNGVVHDIQMRYHGSRFRRSAGRQNYKFQFPRCQLFEGQQGLYETDKADQNNDNIPEDYRTVVGHMLHREAGLPTSFTKFVDLYLNGNALRVRLEQTECDDHTLERFQDEEALLHPQAPRVEAGETYKAKGLSGDEGPFGNMNGRPLTQRTAGPSVPGGNWTPFLRYEWTIPLQNRSWKGSKSLKEMIDAMWVARGDLAAPGALPTNRIATVRAFFEANWDVDKTLTYMALRNWAAPWDDIFHNYYVWRQANGKWGMLPWDFDTEFSGQSSAYSLFFGKFGDPQTNANGRGPQWFKDTFMRAFDAEYRERLYLLNNTLLDPNNLDTLGAFQIVNWRQWATERQAHVNTTLGLGAFQRPNTPTNVSPAAGSSALPPAALQGSVYSRPSPSAHTRSKWEIRADDGTFRAPVYETTSTTALTSLPIPFELLTFGRLYYWRVTYIDAAGHPSRPSTETAFIFGPQPVRVPLLRIDEQTIWKYDQTSQFTNTQWAQPGYNDSAWPSGASLHGAKSGIVEFGTAPDNFPIRTQLTLNNRSAFYFRRHFNFTGDPSSTRLQLKHITDDGLIVFLNGVEVYRGRMSPNAPATYSTIASSAVTSPNLEGPFEIPNAALLPGDNVIAVEVHQYLATSNDVCFGISMDALVPFGSLVINEVLADNVRAFRNGSRNPDYIELYNADSLPVNLGGMSLSDDVLVPGKYVFPPDITIPAFGYLTVWCDSDFGAPGLHTGFGLAAGGQTVALFDGTSALDFVTFGPQAPDFSVGRLPNGSGQFGLNVPTKDAVNVGQSVGSYTGIRINEWMATPASGEDWFELYNPGTSPVAIHGLYLSDAAGPLQNTTIPPLSFIGPQGFAEFLADGLTTGANHSNFKLSASGDSIVLTDRNGVTAIDQVSFGAQGNNVSQGRFPDGAVAIQNFPVTPTPGASNYLLSSILINEVLTNSTAPLEDAIELRNPTGAAIQIGGWWLSDDSRNLKKYRIPAGTSIAAGGYRVVYENQLNPVPASPDGFSLSSAGEETHLSQADGAGALTGFQTRVKFGGAAEGVSFGRVITSNGSDFFPLIGRTFGQDTPASVTQFRTGTGAANAGPAIGPVLLSEIMYHPPDNPVGVDNVRDEFVELHNISTNPQDLSGWELKDSVDYIFPSGSVIRPGDYILVVSFSPTDSATLSAFRARYGISASVAIFGPFAPKLSNSSSTIELARPGLPVGGEIPLILVDRVRYGDVAPWPTTPDGTGPSLQRPSRSTFGNDPTAWVAAAATPGGLNSGQVALTDSDGDQMPDTYEAANGLDRFSAADANTDLDGDGQSNRSEYLAGTDPRNGAQVLRADLRPAPGGGFLIRFSARANRSYTVQYQSTLGGAWQKLVDVPSATADRIVETTDGAPGEQRFYRVTTPQQP